MLICVILFGLDYNNFLLTFLSGNKDKFLRIFELVPGDTGDGALNNWFLERNFTYFKNGGNIFNIEEIFNAKIYWPEKNTLAWSDNWIILTPVYGLLRSFLSPGQAFTGLISVCLSLNVVACYQLCRHATKKKVYRLIASILSVFSLTILARLSHAQLMPAFAGVLAIESFISGLKFKNLNLGTNSEDDIHPSFNKLHLNISKIITGLNWLLLQVCIGFYQGIFFIISTTLLVIILFTQRFILKDIKFIYYFDLFKDNISKIKFALKAIILFFLLTINTQIYAQYYVYSKSTGGRSWSEVATIIPRLWSFGFNTLSTPENISFPAPVQNINSKVFPVFWEHSIFPGYAFYFLIILGIWFGINNLRKDKLNFWPWRVTKLTQVCLFMLIISIGIGGTQPITAWIFLYKFIPGFSALRAVTRIGIPIVLLSSPIIAWTLSEIHIRFERRGRIIIFAFLFMLYLTGNVTTGLFRFDSKVYESKISKMDTKFDLVLDKNKCKAFYLSSPADNSWFSSRIEYQMMAMWISIKNDIPTSSGYSGNTPIGWSHKMDKSQLQEWLRGRGVTDSDIESVCWISGDELLREN